MSLAALAQHHNSSQTNLITRSKVPLPEHAQSESGSSSVIPVSSANSKHSLPNPKASGNHQAQGATTLTAEASGLSLAALASLQQEDTVCSVKTPSTLPVVRSNVSLADLAKQMDSPKKPLQQISLASLANAGNKGSSSSTGRPNTVPGVSLSDIAKSHAGIKPLQPAVVSLTTKNNSPQGNSLEIKKAMSATSLADIAKEHSQLPSSLAAFAKEQNPSSGKTSGKLAAHAGLSLSALAQQHAASTSQGSSGTGGPRVPLQSNRKPPPGFDIVPPSVPESNIKPKGSPPKTLSGILSTSGSPPKTPPGFKNKVPVDLTLLAAQHGRKRTQSTRGVSSGDHAPLKTLACEQVLTAPASAFGQALCVRPTYHRNCNHPLDRYKAFRYERQVGSNACQSETTKYLKPFDFSTPSLDDIVREKQKAAFTRDGRHGMI